MLGYLSCAQKERQESRMNDNNKETGGRLETSVINLIPWSTGAINLNMSHSRDRDRVTWGPGFGHL